MDDTLRLLVVLSLARAALGADNVPVLAVEWDHPRWLNPYRAFAGSARLPRGTSSEQVVCVFRVPGAGERTVPCSPVETDARALRFSIPALKMPVSGDIAFRLESRASRDPSAGSVVWRTDTRTVPASEEVEIEVSGQTDVELVYPLSDWNARIRFTPCCLILSGWIRAERVPVCPAPVSTGLPDRLLSPFYVIEPDDLVKATGGVRIEAAFDNPPDSAFDAAAVTAFRLADGQWTAVLDATTDASEKRVTFPFADGGTFVLGIRRR